MSKALIRILIPAIAAILVCGCQPKEKAASAIVQEPPARLTPEPAVQVEPTHEPQPRPELTTKPQPESEQPAEDSTQRSLKSQLQEDGLFGDKSVKFTSRGAGPSSSGPASKAAVGRLAMDA